MFGYYPRSNRYSAPSYADYGYGFPPQHARPASYEQYVRPSIRRPAVNDPRTRSAHGYYPHPAVEEADLYEKRRRAYLEALELKRAYEQEESQPEFDAAPVSGSNTPEPTPQPNVPLTPSQEQLEEAAATIQQAWRRHLAVRKICSLEHEFTSQKSSFTFPSTLDFLSPSSPDHTTISVPTDEPVAAAPSLPSTAKLAYTKNNAPLHAQNEALSRLLVKLDSVESHGDKRIRQRRKDVVRAIRDFAQHG